MKVEFLVDIISRDLPVACQLESALRESGDEMAITSTFVADGEKRSTFLRSLNEKADFLVTPWYNSNRTLEILARARFARAHLIHFPSEQFFSVMFDREKLNVDSARAYRRQVAAVFVWGQYYARLLVERLGYPRERIYEVGSPRLEFLRRAEHSEDESQTNRPLRVLFISDFTLADLDTKSRRQRFAQTYGVNITAGAISHVASERQYMLDTAQYFSTLAGYEVRIRPHPGERLDPYHAACEKAAMECGDPAVPFSNDVSWSDVVVGYTSTSIFEAAVAGRPFFSLRREQPPEIVYREGLEQLYHTCTAEELIAVLSDSEALEAAGQQLADQAEFYVGNVNNAFKPAPALYSALHHQFEFDVAPVNLGFATIGALRSMSKYLAFRLLASDIWNSFRAWRPASVKLRLLPGYALTDKSISETQELYSTLPKNNFEEPIFWKLGRWSWRPVIDRKEKINKSM